MIEQNDFKQILLDVFEQILRAVDAERAVHDAVRVENNRLKIADDNFNLADFSGVYSIALGKAAFKMARGLDAVLGEKLSAGVISCPPQTEKVFDFSGAWQIFHGGHPTPNEASLAAAKAAFEMLEQANSTDSFVIFLVSGGGSAMMELPLNAAISLADLQKANQVLVTCGATIAEINALRRRFSKVKGGGLSRAANRAAQITLIVSDTNEREVFNVASGPTITSENDFGDAEIAEIIERYKLSETLPRNVIDCLKESQSTIQNPQSKIHNWSVLLGNADAVEAAEKALREREFVVETANDLVETAIDAGCAESVKRLRDLRERVEREKPVAIVSGGEFVCPVRGSGKGGRNLEAALRTAILFDELNRQSKFERAKFAALFAGTDGIDGNSPAAGAIVDETTLDRARELNLNAFKFLRESDSYSFFAALNEQIEIGATGTNVRDVRILLAA